MKKVYTQTLSKDRLKSHKLKKANEQECKNKEVDMEIVKSKEKSSVIMTPEGVEELRHSCKTQPKNTKKQISFCGQI